MGKLLRRRIYSHLCALECLLGIVRNMLNLFSKRIRINKLKFMERKRTTPQHGVEEKKKKKRRKRLAGWQPLTEFNHIL